MDNSRDFRSYDFGRYFYSLKKYQLSIFQFLIMKGHAKIKVEIKNGVLFVYHNDGTLLHKRNATPQTWEKIWQAIEKGRAIE